MGKSKLQAYLWGLISLRVYLVPLAWQLAPAERTHSIPDHTLASATQPLLLATRGTDCGLVWSHLSAMRRSAVEESRLPPVRERDLLNSKIWSLIIIIARAVAKKVAAPAVAKKVAKKTVSKKVKKVAAKKGGKTGKKVARKAVKKVAAPKKWEIDH